MQAQRRLLRCGYAFTAKPRVLRALWYQGNIKLKLTNAIIAGISGMFVAIGFTFNITGSEYFQSFIPYIAAISFVSAFSGVLFKRTKALWLVLTGGFTSLACCLLVLLTAVSNI
jgi:hypothetical protein